MLKSLLVAVGLVATLSTAACLGASESDPIEVGGDTPTIETMAVSQCSYISGKSCTYKVTPNVRCQLAAGEFSTCSCQANSTMHCL